MKTTAKSRIMAYYVLIFVILIWGYSWLVTKSILLYISSFDFTFVRNLAGGLILLMVLKIRDKKITYPPWRNAIYIGVLQTALYSLLTQVALIIGGAEEKIAILAFTMPFWTVLLSYLFLHEKFTPLQWLSIFMAALGLILIFEPWNTSATLFSSFLAVISGLFWAGSNILTKKTYLDHSTDPLVLTTWQMLIGSIVLFFIALLANQHFFIPSIHFWLAFFYSTIISTALGWLLWSFILKQLSPAIAGLSILAIPVLAMLLSWLFMAENLNTVEWIGAVLIITALLLLNIKSIIKRKP